MFSAAHASHCVRWRTREPFSIVPRWRALFSWGDGHEEGRGAQTPRRELCRAGADRDERTEQEAFSADGGRLEDRCRQSSLARRRRQQRNAPWGLTSQCDEFVRDRAATEKGKGKVVREMWPAA